MKIMKCLLILLLPYATFLFSHCALAQANPAINLQGIIDPIVQTSMQQTATPGIAIAIHYGGQDYFFNYGLANKQQNIAVNQNTIFELASITKIFTSTLLAISLQQGKIQLNDPIVKYLPALNQTQNLPIDQVKVVNLATHTASFPRDITDFGVAKTDQAGFYQQLAKWQPSNPIGSQYLYSNVGFGLLGKVLETANGQDFITLLNQGIVGPLNLSNTFVLVPADKTNLEAQGYRQNGEPAPFYTPNFLYGGGALRSSSADMLQFLDANMGVGNVNSTSFSAMQLTQQSYVTVKPTFAMGLGWQRMFRNGNLFMTKNGMNQGFNTFVGFSPLHQYGVVVLTNKRDGNASRIGNQILNQLSTV
jgi:beta-lactamase class C